LPERTLPRKQGKLHEGGRGRPGNGLLFRRPREGAKEPRGGEKVGGVKAVDERGGNVGFVCSKSRQSVEEIRKKSESWKTRQARRRVTGKGFWGETGRG